MAANVTLGIGGKTAIRLARTVKVAKLLFLLKHDNGSNERQHQQTNVLFS